MAQKRRQDEAHGPDRLRVHVEIDASVRKRLGAYASYHRVTEAQVIEDALSGKLKGFYVGQREPGASVVYSPASEGEDRPVLPIRTG